MSHRQQEMVWRQSQADGVARSVLACIARYADDDGTNAWPSRETIAHETGFVESTVKSAIKRLQKVGELTVETQAGGPTDRRARWRPNLYRITLRGAGDAPRDERDGGRETLPVMNGTGGGRPRDGGRQTAGRGAGDARDSVNDSVKDSDGAEPLTLMPDDLRALRRTLKERPTTETQLPAAFTAFRRASAPPRNDAREVVR